MSEDQFVPEDLEDDPDEDTRAIMSFLENDPEFSKKFDELVIKVAKSGCDVSKLHSQILLLIEDVMKKMVVKNYIKRLLEKLNGNSESVKVKINKLAIYLMKNKKKYIGDHDLHDLTNPMMLEVFLTKASARNLRAVLLRFMIYEAYKLLSPRRMAGETREQNYISNYILRGAKVADKFDRSMTTYLAKHNPKLLKHLQKKHEKFKRGKIGGGKLSVPGPKSSGTSYV